MEDPDEDEVMIGEVQVNEEVEHPTSEVSVTEFDDWQQKEHEENFNHKTISRVSMEFQVLRSRTKRSSKLVGC